MINPGITAFTSENMEQSFTFSVTSFAMSMGFFLYALAAAMAPLHWYSQRSGRLDRVIFAYPMS